jgi:hypothetical protein
MSFLSKALGVIGLAPKQFHVTVEFGPTMITELNEYARTNPGKSQVLTTVEFPPDLLKEINDCIQNHHGTSRVMYSDDLQILDVVGESYRQDTLQTLYKQVQDNWIAGFLLPEPYNPYDANAVSVVAIGDLRTNEETGEIDGDVYQVGYLGREQAEYVSSQLIMFLENDAYIPIVCKLAGGTTDKPLIGVIARAKTDKIQFE